MLGFVWDSMSDRRLGKHTPSIYAHPHPSPSPFAFTRILHPHPHPFTLTQGSTRPTPPTLALGSDTTCSRFAGSLRAPSQAKSSRVESSLKAKSSRVESSRVESSQVESSRVESSQVESGRVESSQVESSRVDPRATWRHAAPQLSTWMWTCFARFWLV